MDEPLGPLVVVARLEEPLGGEPDLPGPEGLFALLGESSSGTPKR